MKFVPHARREAMTLGDYIQRHSYINNTNEEQPQYMTDILKRKIQEVIGESANIFGADLIDWEFADYRTNPGTHAQEDARIKASVAQGGRGPNSETIVETTIESHLNGRAANELGEAALIGYVNDITGEVNETDKPTYDLEQVLRDAKRLTQLTPEGTFLKNFFENEVMMLYSSPEFDQAKVEHTIQQYTELRLKECMLKPEFEKSVKTGNNGHYYLKMLKEQIADELSISQPAKASDFLASKMMEDPFI